MRKYNLAMKQSGFTTPFSCDKCNRSVNSIGFIGTHNRNHCPFCLFSQHVDALEAGDRRSKCHGLMEPVGLTFKKERSNKYGQSRPGELMLVHECIKCGKISLNRLASDDDPDQILTLVSPRSVPENIDGDITILTQSDLPEIHKQLFGK